MLLAREKLSDLLPYLAYDEKRGFFALDTGVGFIIECNPYFADQTTIATIRSLFEADFPEKTSIQFMLYASPYIDDFLNAYILMRENNGSSVYTEMARRRAEFLRKKTFSPIVKGSSVILRNFRLIISVVLPCSLKSPEQYEQRIEDGIKVKESVLNILRSAGMSPEMLNITDVITLLNELLNPSHDRREYSPSYDPEIPIKDQILFTDTIINVEKDYLEIDGKICKSYSVRQFPQEWSISEGINYIGSLMENTQQIGCPFFVTLNIEYPAYVKVKGQIERKSLSAGYQAFGPLGKFFPKLAMKKQNFDNFMVALENGSNPIYAYMNIFLYTDSIKHSESVGGTLQSLFRSMNFVLQEDNYIGLPMFLTSLPMSYASEIQADLRRRKTLTTENVSELIPIQSDWKSGGPPVIPLISRRGQLFFIDFFSNPSGGYSGIISAATGAGKSFFVNEIILSYLGIGSKIWVIDVGRSYEKLCSFVGGNFIVFSVDSNICINPFSRINNIDDDMPILKSILAQMASDTMMDKLSLAHIEEAIKAAYEQKGSTMTVTDVAMYLENKNDPLQKELAKRLYPYTAKGAYASFFEGESSLKYPANLVVFEMEELKTKKDLQEVVLLSIIFMVQQEMVHREKLKILMIDEAWDLLTGGNTTTFIETAYRRIRKYRGSCFAITQSINDFYRIPAGVAIVENSDYYLLLRQRAESIEALKKSNRVLLSENMYDILKSVTTDTGNYSEIFCYTPTGIGVGRLIVDRFTQLLYSSKADEYVRIKEKVEAGMNITDAINKIIEEESNT